MGLSVRITIVLLAIMATSIASSRSAEPGPRRQKHLLTSDKLRQELALPFGAVLDQVELRQITSQISETRQVSILIDRRLDPSHEHRVEIKDVALSEALRQIAALANANASFLDNAVYLGPAAAAKKLRTLIELRANELQSPTSGIPDLRRKELQRRRDISWNDFDTPREILKSITSLNHLEIKNDELIPHDLWSAASLPNATITQALSLVLIQFDLTFCWLSSGQAIELVPIPDKVMIRRSVRPRLSPLAAMEELRQQFPDASISAGDSELTIVGTAEEHEAISMLLTGTVSTRPAKKDVLKDIKQRLFTFSVPNPVPLDTVMKKLEESDIHFEYDAQEFADAGVDLQQLVDVNVVNASADQFFRKLFEPVNLSFVLDRKTVKLKPKPPRPAKN